MTISRQQTVSAAGAQTAEADENAKGPRARTQRLMLETATRLMQGGITPSVSQVSEVAGVSRATAYRYFPSQAALVQAVVNEGLGPILRWESSLDDAEARVVDLLEFSMPRVEEFEATFRAALKLSLDQWARRQAGTLGEEEKFRRGHRLELLEDCVEPLKEVLGPDELGRLVAGLSLIFGIESILVLKDINGLDASQTQEIVIWAARAIVRHAIASTEEKSASLGGAGND